MIIAFRWATHLASVPAPPNPRLLGNVAASPHHHDWLPAPLIAAGQSHSVVRYSEPRILSTLFDLAIGGFLLSAFLSQLYLPRKKGHHTLLKRIGHILEWLLVPPISIAFGARARHRRADASPPGEAARVLGDAKGADPQKPVDIPAALPSLRIVRAHQRCYPVITIHGHPRESPAGKYPHRGRHAGKSTRVD